MRTVLFILFSLGTCMHSNSQALFQKISGKVMDKDNHQPLAGASVMIIDMEKEYSTASDSLGFFLFEQVPVGRVRIQCSYVGYEDFITEGLVLNSVKALEVNIEMEGSKQQQQNVIIRTKRNPKLPVNKYAIVSGRSFTAEETQRFAARANDPGRMAVGFPGVQATRDTRNDIIIRGNNPVGLQWKLEGIDIINPNHFARKASSGGGITILSLSMLDQSDFLTGAMPADYGDALSGVFDMHFRKGNDQQNEYTFKAGMIGIDFSAEGPISRNNSSFLVNYRYSTLGILDALGLNLVDERESNNFQDLSFNLSFGNGRQRSQWNIWGIGGLSKEIFSAVEDTLEWKQYDDYAVYDYRTSMGAIGIGNTTKLSGRSFLKSTIALIGQMLNHKDDTLNKSGDHFNIGREKYNTGRLSFSSAYHIKFSPVVNMKTGVYASNIHYGLNQQEIDFNSGNITNPINSKGNSWLLQPYWQMNFKPGKWTVNPGLHLMYLGLNKKTALDPRLSVQYKISPVQNISLAYGLHSKMLPIGSYFYQQGTGYPNKELDMMRSHHFILSFDRLLGKGWRFSTEAYYQRLFNIPIINDENRTFWILNELEGYATQALVSKGKGTNKGIDLTIEKFFNKGLFTIAAFSIFRSTYQPLNGKEYNTRFNSGSTGSWTGAKEWNLKKNKVIQLGWKMIYNGGLPLTPLANIQNNSREAVLDESRPYSEKVPAYFRTDARVSLRKNKVKSSWQLAIDIQNVLGLKNTDGLSRRYDPSVNQWIYKEQSGFVPILSYQVDF